MEKKKHKYAKEISATAVGVSSSSSAPSPPWIELPYDVTTNILKRVDGEEILRSAQNVCATWWKVCHDPAMWRAVRLVCRDDINKTLQPAEFDRMCRGVVDRCKGQAIGLSITYFREHQSVLDYIAKRTYEFRHSGLPIVAEKFGPSKTKFKSILGILRNLEELHLVGLPSVRAKDLARIGASCPMLKSFTFIQHFPDDEASEYNDGKYCKWYGIFIGRTMPNLRRLQLSSNRITNKQVQVILDRCPLLEALNLQLCSNLNLQGDLAKRCDKMAARFFETS